MLPMSPLGSVHIFYIMNLLYEIQKVTHDKNAILAFSQGAYEHWSQSRQSSAIPSAEPDDRTTLVAKVSNGELPLVLN